MSKNEKYFEDFKGVLQNEPNQTLKGYCSLNNIKYHALYSWMQRKGYKMNTIRKEARMNKGVNDMSFVPIIPDKPIDKHDYNIVSGMHIAIPGGVVIQIDECSTASAIDIIKSMGGERCLG